MAVATKQQIKPPRLHPGQLVVADSPARFRVLAAGRRWGKTRLGAAECVETAVRGGVAWWVAPTYKVARVGWRTIKMLGLQIPGAEKSDTDRILTLPSSGWVQVRSAEDPDSLRGDGLDLVVMDECAYTAERAWTEGLRPALSDKRGRALFISTPRGGNWFYTLYKRGQTGDPRYQSWTFKSVENPFLAPEEIDDARGDLTTRVFRQEYEADFLGDPEGALWKRDDILHGDHPELVRVAVAIDPAVTATAKSDETGIIVAGKGVDGRAYVLADASGRFSPSGWADCVARAYDDYTCDRVIAETNNGGDLVERNLRSVRSGLPYTAVHATRGKVTRAEPVAALYEQHKVTHCGVFPALEDQLCTWLPESGTSPDRLDALVWALTYLMLEPAKPRLRAI